MLQFSIRWLLPALRLGTCWEYPSKSPPGPSRKHLSGFKHQQDLWCATSKPPKHKCLTKSYCSSLSFEVFQFPLFLGAFPPNQLWESRWKKLETSIKNGEISYKAGGRWGCTVPLAEHLILYRGSTSGKARSRVLIHYSHTHIPPPTRRLWAASFARAESVPVLAHVTGCSAAPGKLLPKSLAAAQLGWPWHWKRVTMEAAGRESAQLHPSHRHCLPWSFLWQVSSYKFSGTDAFTALRALPLLVFPHFLPPTVTPL